METYRNETKQNYQNVFQIKIHNNIYCDICISTFSTSYKIHMIQALVKYIKFKMLPYLVMHLLIHTYMYRKSTASCKYAREYYRHIISKY